MEGPLVDQVNAIAESPPSVGAPASRAMRRTALTVLVILVLACCTVAAAIVAAGLTGDGPRQGALVVPRLFWGLAPLLVPGLCMAVAIGFCLSLVMRLAAPAVASPLGGAWRWPPIAGLVLIGLANVVLLPSLADFIAQEGGFAVRLWLTLVGFAVALLGQALRLAILARRSAARPSGVGLLLATAILGTLGFLLVSALLVYELFVVTARFVGPELR